VSTTRYAIAAMLVCVSTAQAQDRPIIPPVEFDQPYEGKLQIDMYDNMDTTTALCPKLPLGKPEIACAYPGKDSCRVILPSKALAAKIGWDHSAIYRHEIGHCNGWGADHSGARWHR
jgi:hypothetical protein